MWYRQHYLYFIQENGHLRSKYPIPSQRWLNRITKSRSLSNIRNHNCLRHLFLTRSIKRGQKEMANAIANTRVLDNTVTGPEHINSQLCAVANNAVLSVNYCLRKLRDLLIVNLPTAAVLFIFIYLLRYNFRSKGKRLNKKEINYKQYLYTYTSKNMLCARVNISMNNIPEIDPARLFYSFAMQDTRALVFSASRLAGTSYLQLVNIEQAGVPCTDLTDDKQSKKIYGRYL